MEVKFESFEEMDEFCKRWYRTIPEPITLNVEIPKTIKNKKTRKNKKTTSDVKKNDFVDFPQSTQKRYELKWAMAKYNEDWWTLRYKNGQGYKKFEHNLLELYFLKTFNGKITENELKKYAKQFNMSSSKLRKIIWNLKVGTFDKYFRVVDNEVKQMKMNVLRSNRLIINNIETDITSIEAKGLLFSIQNAPNKAREVLKQYKQFEHKIELKQYFLLCWNYDNSKVLDIVRFGGI